MMSNAFFPAAAALLRSRGWLRDYAAVGLLCVASQALGLQVLGQDVPPFRNPQLSPEARIADLVSRMTLAEKIDCLSTDTAIARLGAKSFSSFEGIHGVVQRDDEKRHRPAIMTTHFPQPPGMGESWDPALVRQAAAVGGSCARPALGRSEEVSCEDPFFNGTMVVNFIHGLQGDDPNHWQAASRMKHFLANSNEDHRTSSNSVFDEQLFWEYYSVPFRMGFLKGGAKGVMASYDMWNGTPRAVNPILKSIVEDQWGADVLSGDGGAVKLLWTDHKKFPDQKSAVLACLHADINQFLDTCKDETAAAVKEGPVSGAEIDGLPRRTFVISLKLGLLDPTHMAHALKDEGTAIAKVLFGDDNPGGHLVTTWPMSIDQLPPMLDDNIRDGRTYMYFKSKPLYAFGYRLSYTT